MTHFTLRICIKGHRYNKSNNCPVCPTCATEEEYKKSFLSIFSAPARKGFIMHDILEIKDLTNFTEEEIINMNGVGKKALDICKGILAEMKLDFKK